MAFDTIDHQILSSHSRDLQRKQKYPEMARFFPIDLTQRVTMGWALFLYLQRLLAVACEAQSSHDIQCLYEAIGRDGEA